MDDLYHFLQSQRLATIATRSDNGTWIANVFYGVDTKKRLYFISSDDTKHSQHMTCDPQIAFSVAWFNPLDHTDRKAIQGHGFCYKSESDTEIAMGVSLHNSLFPEFADRITFDWIKNNGNDSHVWVIKPKYIKFWNDELYGEEETREFQFQ